MWKTYNIRNSGFSLNQETASLNQRNINLIYGQRKNFFELKKILLNQKNFFNVNKSISLDQKQWFLIKKNFL